MTTDCNLLLCLAHPDDESFGSGGMLAHYAAEGVHTTLVCATGGEVGEISEAELATPENLAQVREDELRCACETLGVKDLVMLGYRDSGMAGTSENEDDRAFMNIPAEEVVPRLVGLIRSLKPQLVITFDPHGGYGHPDHITIHKHTVAAFHAAGDPQRYPEQGAAWQPDRLYYTVIPRSFLQGMHSQMLAAGIDTGGFDNYDLDTIGYPDEGINVTLDVSPFVEAKWTALYCHRTQFGPDNPFRSLPQEQMFQMMSREYFVQVWPEPEPSIHLTDLFAGL